MHFKKNSTFKKYLNDNDFLILIFGFIRMEVDKTLFFQVVMTSYTIAY